MIEWIQRLLWHSLTMSVIVAAYYGVTIRLRNRYDAKWFYIAGVILLVGFFIPFRPVLTIAMEKAPTFLQNAVNQAEGLLAANPPSQQGASETQRIAQSFPWHAAFAVWAVGALGTIIYHIIKYLRFTQAVTRWRMPVQDGELLARFEEAKRALSLESRKIALARCACVQGPMFLWLGGPTILVPESMAAVEDSRFILLHELIHYKRKDLLSRLLMLLTIAVQWFNPAVYLLVKLVTLQCEMSCDQKVVENQPVEGRHQYAMSIIGIARHQSRGYSLLTTSFYGGKDTMKKRISSIYEPAKKKIASVLLFCALMLTLAAGTSIAADSKAAFVFDGTPPGAPSIVYTLPENVSIKTNEAVDSYIVAWDSIENIMEYRLGMYFNAVGVDGEEFWIVAEGWVGTQDIADGTGAIYSVGNAVWESITLDGKAKEVDIAGLINKHMDMWSVDLDGKKEKIDIRELLGCHLTIVAIRESGEPIQVDIQIPTA